MTNDRDLDQLLGQLAEDGRERPDPAEHPSDGTLSFYHARKLSPDEEDRVREHLVQCKRCRDLLLEYAEFMGMEGEEGEGNRERIADFATAVEGRRLRERVGEEERKQRIDPAYEPGTGRGFFRSLKTAYSIAAMLALAVVGLFIYSADLRWERDRPVLDSAWSEFSRPTRGGGDPGKLIEVPANEPKTVVFALPAHEEDAQGPHHLEIYFEDERIFGPGELRKQDEDDAFFTVTWRSSGLKSGKYEFRVFREGSPEPVGKYFFTIVKR